MTTPPANVLRDFENYAAYWSVAYSIIGLLFIIYAIIYLVLAYPTIKSLREINLIAFFAQVTYISALFVKGFGSFGCSLFFIIPLIKNKKEAWPLFLEKWNYFSVIPSGYPGYVSAICYSVIFFSWCALCVEYLSRDAKQFYNHSQRILKILLIMICTLLVVFTFMISFVDKKYHYVEAAIACFRDTFIAIWFLIYLVKISKQFDSVPFKISKSPESILYMMCVMLAITLILRVVSILVYILGYSESKPISEFSLIYLLIFMIEQLITEILPLGSIGAVKFISSDDLHHTSYEYEAAFTNYE